ACNDRSYLLGSSLGDQLNHDWSIEVSSDYLGEVEIQVGTPLAKSNLSIYSITPKLTAPVGENIEFYVKFGGAIYEYAASENYTFVGGFGFNYHLDNQIKLGLGYLTFPNIGYRDVQDGIVNSLALELTYRFSSAGEKGEQVKKALQDVNT
ncbi:outer membrane beta-barrel protein, partial [Vibrio parahaemolyticus]|uniref:outer membrane beta-barrel protein n=1 Tax=Vibrio parahaemolyticus TaxID=670 RepID=UPI0005F25766